MNTAKILDMLPQAAPAAAAPKGPERVEPRIVAPAGSGGPAADLVNRQAEARARAVRRDLPQPRHSLERKVGLAEDSFDVFIDLVSPRTPVYRYRVFGPSESPAALVAATPEGAAPSGVRAYRAAAAEEPAPPRLQARI